MYSEEFIEVVLEHFAQSQLMQISEVLFDEFINASVKEGDEDIIKHRHKAEQRFRDGVTILGLTSEAIERALKGR